MQNEIINELPSVLIFSHDEEYAQMLLLLLRKNGISVALGEGDASSGHVLHLYELDSLPQDTEFRLPAIGITRNAAPSLRFPILRRPFRYHELLSLLFEEESLKPQEGGGEKPCTRQSLLLLQGRRACLLGDTEISLSPTEHRLLLLLDERRHSVVSASELSRVCQFKGGGNSLAVYMTHLRKKIERDGVRRLYSVHGVGYRLEP